MYLPLKNWRMPSSTTPAGARRVVSEAAAALAEQLYWVIELFGIDTVIFSWDSGFRI